MWPKKMAMIAGATVIIALHQVCFITSLSYTSIAASTFLTCTQPIFTAFLGYIFLKERVSLRSLLAIVGAVAGDGCDYVWRRQQRCGVNGNLLAFAASVLAAIFVLFARKFRQTTPLVPFMLVLHVSGSLFQMILAGFSSVSLVGFSSASWTALLMLALIPTLDWAHASELFSWTSSSFCRFSLNPR